MADVPNALEGFTSEELQSKLWRRNGHRGYVPIRKRLDRAPLPQTQGLSRDDPKPFLGKIQV